MQATLRFSQIVVIISYPILLLPLPHASGTVGYMAPEVIQPGVSYDIEADWFSLGCVIYQFLTGCVMWHERMQPDNVDHAFAGHQKRSFAAADLATFPPTCRKLPFRSSASGSAAKSEIQKKTLETVRPREWLIWARHPN